MEIPIGDLKRSFNGLVSSIALDGWRILYGGMRYAFISRELLFRVVKEMMRILGASMKTIVFQFESLTSFAEASHIISSGVPPDEALEKYASFLSASGWGYTKLVSCDLDKPEVIVRIYNSVIASWFRDNIEDLERTMPFYDCAPLGYSWIGAVRAALEGLGVRKPSLQYEESECLAKGGKYCEFIVTGENSGLHQTGVSVPGDIFNYESVKALFSEHPAPGNPNEFIRGFIGALEVREDGSIGIRRDRIFLAPSTFFSVACWMLPIERFGDMIYSIYRRSYNEYGQLLSKRGEKYGAEGVANFFLSSCSAMGWGRMVLTELNGSKAKFQIYQSLLGEDSQVYMKLKGLNPQPSCAIMGYIMEGILSYFATKEGKPPLLATENKCVAKGDDYCEFTIKPL